MVHMTLTMPIRAKLVITRLTFDTAFLYTKFDESSLRHSTEI